MQTSTFCSTRAVNATFSEAMDPVTITAPGTFTLAVSGAGGAAVAGNVTYNSVSHIATFTPTANLTASTQYTATITNAAKDVAGNALAAGAIANPWTFTTGASRRPGGAEPRNRRDFRSFWGRRRNNQSGNQHGDQWRYRDHRCFYLGDRIPRCGAGMHLHGNGKQRGNSQREHRHSCPASDRRVSVGRHRHHLRDRDAGRKRLRSPHITTFHPLRGPEARIQARASSADSSSLLAYTKPQAARS